MFKSFKVGFLAALTALGWSFAAPASATLAVTSTTFYFSANCTDCATFAGQPGFAVSGQLVLSNYALGEAISTSNFESFTYNGSNLVDAFSVTWSGDDGDGATRDFNANTIYAIGGSISTIPGFNDFNMTFDDALFFRSFVDGNFELCAPKGNTYYGGNSCFSNISDFGSQTRFSTTPPAAVPEPGTLALLGLSLFGIAALRRRAA